MSRLPIGIFFTLISMDAAFAQHYADLVLLNGKIWTVSDVQPQAEAVACTGSRYRVVPCRIGQGDQSVAYEALRPQQNAGQDEDESQGCQRQCHAKNQGNPGKRRPATLWRFPLETVSLSEGGFERIYQGSLLLLQWRFRLPGKSEEFRVRCTQSTSTVHIPAYV